MDADLPISFVYKTGNVIRCYPIRKLNKSEIGNCFGNILWYFVYYFLFYVYNGYAIFPICFKINSLPLRPNTHIVRLFLQLQL